MQTELVELRSFYGPPGLVLLACVDGEPVGCIALRALAPGVGEVRRLYVTDAVRSSGLGRRLVRQLLDVARSAGLRRLVLNTLPTMVHARALYADLGFTEVDPYVDDPTAGVHYLALDLGTSA